jgi:hypothetical protein
MGVRNALYDLPQNVIGSELACVGMLGTRVLVNGGGGRMLKAQSDKSSKFLYFKAFLGI